MGFMCNRFRASFEFREVKVRWNLLNDLPEFRPIYNIAPHRKEADMLAIVGTDAGNEGRLMYCGTFGVIVEHLGARQEHLGSDMY